MTMNSNPTQGTATGDAIGTSAALLSVVRVATLLGCSIRTIYRLSDSGRMPRPVALGRLRRWDRNLIERWISSGCPDLRREQRARA